MNIEVDDAVQLNSVSAAHQNACRWSLMDNFEWSDGFGTRFGIVHVDYHLKAELQLVR